MHIERQRGAAIPDALMEEFSAFVAQQVGLHFPRERWPDLSRAMMAIARDSTAGFDPSSGLRSLTGRNPTRNDAELLARHLSVGETYFFREPAVFNTLERDILPPLIAARRNAGKTLRIWSAGCCTGEELYSIAILLDRLIPDADDWTLTLLGTDVNPQFLHKAKLGVYRDWSFRNVPAWIRRRYFQATEDGNYVIAPQLRCKLAFDYLNLATDPYPGQGNDALAMDIVFCRNVLMYFEPDCAARVIDGLHRSLAVDGWLTVSPAEAGSHAFGQFEHARFSDATFFRKRDGGLFRSAASTAKSTSTSTLAPEDATADKFALQAAAARINRHLTNESVADAQAAAFLATQARRCADDGRLDEAERLCLAAIAADKCDPGLRYLHALVLEEQDRLDAAIAALKPALFLDPGFVLAHFTLGNLCRRRHRDEEADRHFANVAALLHRLAPDDVLDASEGITAGHLFDTLRVNRRTS